MIRDDELIALKTRCVALLFDCPKREPKVDCPFSQVRNDEDVVRRVDWLKSKTQTELASLLSQHVECYTRPH